MASAPAAVPVPASGPALCYLSALSAFTTRFFLWGFIASLNDILIPYLWHGLRGSRRPAAGAAG